MADPTFVSTVTRNFVKPFFIAGFIIGEVYVALLLLAPPASPEHNPVHWSGALTAILLFGPFGGAVGGGLGIIATAIASKFTRK